MKNTKKIEYIVRDYSAVDAQVEEIAKREKQKTRQLQISNLSRITFLGLYILVGLSLFALVCGIAYRIAFPPDIEVVEKTKIVEKIVEPQPIIINAPTNEKVTNNAIADRNARIFGTDDITENKTISSNTVNNDESVIGKRSVTTFTEIPSYIKNYGPVVTGWKWDDINSKKPVSEYCYITKQVGALDSMRYDLAWKEASVTSEATLSQIKSSGLSINELKNLISKCRWFAS